MFSLYKHRCKTCDPRAGPYLALGHNLNKLGRESALGLVVSDTKIYSCFPHLSLCKTCDPPGAGPFWPQEHNLYKLGRGPLDDASYQISRLYALWF